VERTPKIHFLTGTQGVETIGIGLQDVVVDLTFRAQLSSLRSRVGRYFCPTGYQEDRFRNIAYPLLERLESIPQEFSYEGRSLSDWTQWDERYNLLWASEVTTCLPDSLIVRGPLSLLGFDAATKREISRLSEENECQLHASFSEREVWQRSLEDVFGSHLFLNKFAGNLPAEFANAKWGAESLLRIVRDTFFIADQEREFAIAPRKCDVLFMALPLSYSYEHEVPRDRYHPGLIHYLRSSGIDLGVMPCVQGAWSQHVFQNRKWLFDEETPDWSLLYFPQRLGVSLAKRFASKVVEIAPVLGALKRSRIELNGLDLSPWYAHELKVAIGHVGFEQLYLYESLRSSFRRIKPKVVLLKDEFYQTGMTVTAAADCKVFGIQHGLIPVDHFVYVKPESLFLDSRVRRVRCDKFFTYGDGANEIICSRGMSPERLVSSGSVRHNVRETETPDQMNPRSILVCLETREQARLLLEIVHQALKQLLLDGSLEARPVLRPHPRVDTSDIVEAVFMDFPGGYILSKGSLEDALESAHWVITESSTSGMDALARGKVLLVHQQEGLYQRFPYVAEGAALGFSDAKSLFENFSKPKPHVEKFLERHLWGKSNGGKEVLLNHIKVCL